MKNRNIVLFSSGISEKNGVLKNICSVLEEKGYSCSIWRDLFANANDSNNIALLPMLIKKIPTFDYAVLICEGHDITYISRGLSRTKVYTMRDNVLFEIGLCAMALGLNRTILITDEKVRLPDDLTGVDNHLAVKQICIPSKDRSNVSECAERIGEQIDEYIIRTGDELHQVIIGAAASIACGYVSNFICRTLEHIDEEILIELDSEKDIKSVDEKYIIESDSEALTIKVPLEKVHLRIVLPYKVDESVISSAKLKKEDLLEGSVPSARNRPAHFSCYFENDELHIVDYPTCIVTSYDTAKMILGMDADDTMDVNAASRFTAKELNMYEATINSLLNKEYIRQIVQQHYSLLPDEERAVMENRVMDIIENRLTIIREE